MRWNRRVRKLVWMPGMVAAVAIGSAVAWSASGADRTERERVRAAPGESVGLQIDEAYVGMSGLLMPGEVAGAPVADVAAVPADGPRARPGFASVLVYMDPVLKTDAAERANLRAFAARRGGLVKHEYRAVMPNVINLRDIPESELEALEKLPGVVRVERDEYHPNALMLHDSTPLIRGLQSQITGAGYSADGAGVRICIVDTGIDSDHIMYSDRIDTSAGYDFFNDDSNPEDDHGHGSHCSGIAAGGTGLSWDPCGTGAIPFQGVAPEATLIGVKVLNSQGGGYDSDIIAGIDYCADQTASGARADVISMSIGTGQYSGPCSHSWAVAANNAVANGVVAVAASGNENYSNALSSPACGANVIAVGMTWKADYPTCEDNITNWNWGICTDYAPQTDDVGCFSNESDYLDVTAPGANVWSASIAAGGTSITGSSGTSMSCPHVAGLAALVLGMDGSLTPAEVRQIIRDGAIDFGPTGFDRAYGYGRIDVLDSLALVGPGCSVPADCDDGLWCNGAEDCVSGSCVAGTPPDCSDGVGCTDDSCNEGTDSCDNVANDANCDNGLWCDGDETCHATLGCQSGTAPDCNDGVACTDDSCNEGTDSCDNVANDANCDNALFCDGAETCHSTLGCQAGSDPCPGQICDEVNDVCCECEFDADCDDGLFCNGAETCPDGCTCQAGTDPCPGQFCNETTDTCETVECMGAGDCDDASDCTVDTCVDNICHNDCPSTVSTFPYTEGFESGWGDWVNAAGDGMDWSRNSGSTPSSST
ncbi:MAG: S8 family serine peptidase, partial [Phycisphaerales bacterium]